MEYLPPILIEHIQGYIKRGVENKAHGLIALHHSLKLSGYQSNFSRFQWNLLIRLAIEQDGISQYGEPVSIHDLVIATYGYCDRASHFSFRMMLHEVRQKLPDRVKIANVGKGLYQIVIR